MDFLKELLGRCVGKSAPVQKNLEKASVSNSMGKIEVVDLGLPSGVLWATENLGISSVYPLGKYFAWGETECKTSYGWDSYTLCKGTSFMNSFPAIIILATQKKRISGPVTRSLVG